MNLIVNLTSSEGGALLVHLSFFKTSISFLILELILPTFLGGWCLDNQWNNCDRGNIGFGGALTVHLIDNKLIKHLLKGEEIYVFNKLEKIFKNLRQTPVLQKCKILK